MTPDKPAEAREREAFEKWYLHPSDHATFDDEDRADIRGPDGNYRSNYTPMGAAWEAWQARASLAAEVAQPKVVMADPFEGHPHPTERRFPESAVAPQANEAAPISDEPKLLPFGYDWKTLPEFAALRLGAGAMVSIEGVDAMREHGILASDIERAVGAFVDMDADCVLTFKATERTRLYVGQQVDRLRATIESLQDALRQALEAKA